TDNKSGRLRCRNVDMIETDTIVANHLHLCRVGLKHTGADPVGDTGADGIVGAHGLNQLSFAHGSVITIQGDIKVFLHGSLGLLRPATGDQYSWFCHTACSSGDALGWCWEILRKK